MPRHPRVNFYTEKRKDKKTGELKTKDIPICFSLSAGFRFKSTTGILIDENIWDAEKQRVTASHSHATRLNKQLSDLKKELEDLCYNWKKRSN